MIMNIIKNLVIHMLFAGCGSVALGYYFVPDYFLSHAIGLLIIGSLLVTVAEFVTDYRIYSVNFHSVSGGSDGQYAAEGNQMSVVYYMIGTILAGAIVLLL